MALTSRTDFQMNIRLPKGMRERLAASANANNRSINAEIVARLESSFGSEVSAQAEYQELQMTIQEALKAIARMDRHIIALQRPEKNPETV